MWQIYETSSSVNSLQWNPNQAFTLLAVAFGSRLNNVSAYRKFIAFSVALLNPRLGAIAACNATDKMCEAIPDAAPESTITCFET